MQSCFCILTGRKKKSDVSVACSRISYRYDKYLADSANHGDTSVSTQNPGRIFLLVWSNHLMRLGWRFIPRCQLKSTRFDSLICHSLWRQTHILSDIQESLSALWIDQCIGTGGGDHTFNSATRIVTIPSRINGPFMVEVIHILGMAASCDTNWCYLTTPPLEKPPMIVTNELKRKYQENIW